MAEYSGFTGRKGTALRSVTRVLWFWVASHTVGEGQGRTGVSVYRSQLLYIQNSVSNKLLLCSTETTFTILWQTTIEQSVSANVQGVFTHV